jgi:hypothetical protein
MDSFLIKEFLDRIYRINRILFLFQFPEETEKTQTDSVGVKHPIIIIIF